MVTQAKKIKTKKGDLMMFATLYDLETSVEIIVFGKTLATCEDALAHRLDRARAREGRSQGPGHDRA